MGLLDDAREILGRDVSPGALDLLTEDLNARLRVREMEVSYYTVPQKAVPLPSFFVEAVSVDIDGVPLAPTTPQLLRSGTFAISGEEIRLADSGKMFRMDYLSRIPPFEQEVANRVYTAYPGLYLYGLLAHHCVLVRDDDGASRFAPRFEQALIAANTADVRARQSQISMRPVPRYSA